MGKQSKKAIEDIVINGKILYFKCVKDENLTDEDLHNLSCLIDLAKIAEDMLFYD
jgi:hypothetical protein